MAKTPDYSIWSDRNICLPYFVSPRLAAAEDELRNLRGKAGILSDYETQVRRLRDDIALLTGRRDALLRSAPSVKEELPSYRPSTPSKLFRSEEAPAPLG